MRAKRAANLCTEKSKHSGFFPCAKRAANLCTENSKNKLMFPRAKRAAYVKLVENNIFRKFAFRL